MNILAISILICSDQPQRVRRIVSD